MKKYTWKIGPVSFVLRVDEEGGHMVGFFGEKEPANRDGLCVDQQYRVGDDGVAPIVADSREQLLDLGQFLRVKGFEAKPVGELEGD